MKVEPFIILILFLNFNDSEPEYSYKLWSYKKVRKSLQCIKSHVRIVIKSSFVEPKI